MLIIFWTSLIGASTQCFALANDAGVNSTRTQLDKIEKLVLLNRQEAISLLSEIESDVSVMESQSLQSYVLNIKGYIELMGGNYPLAVSHFHTARELATASSNRVQEAESYRREGAFHLLFNQYSQALALLDKSLKLHLASGSQRVTESLSAILNIYEILKQNDQQMQYGWLLLEESIKFEDYENIAVAHYSIGMAFLSRGDFEQARYHFIQLKKANNMGLASSDLYSYLAFSALYKAENDLQSSLTYIIQAKTLVENSSFVISMPSILTTESEIRFALGEAALAIQLLNRAIFIADENQLDNYQIRALEVLASIYEKQGEPILALQSLKRKLALEAENQIAAERQLLTINQAQLDLDTKNREIDKLKYEQDLNQQQQTNQFLLLAFTFLIIVILSFFMLRLRKQKTALRLASKEIQRATNAKSDFLARMSHEIRTPLNAIIGLTKLSLRSSEDQRQATNLKQVEESSQTLLALINDILDFSKIEAGKMTLETVPFALDKVIDSAIRMNALKAREKGLELIKFVGPDVPLEIAGDALRLQQVLNNLLSNAVKFTTEGSISIVVNRQYSEKDLLLKFEVKDTGRGISTAQKAILFDSFSQADESITRNYGGTGLGLAISKQLVELMKGKIWVESVPSQGATFLFTIKTKTAEPQDFMKSEQEGQCVSALVINSDRNSSQLIEQTLKRMNIPTTLAVDGMLGIEKMRQAEQNRNPFDMVFIELNMPDIDGIEATSIIRQEINNSQPKIVVLMEDELSGNQLLNQHAELDGYLVKPLNASSLFDCIMGMMKRPNAASKSLDMMPATTTNWQGVHILLAEDNALNRKVALGYLADTHAKVSVAENGDLAVKALENDKSIDVVLMDIQMPVMDGLSATRKIRNQLKLDLPIIAMTAHAIDEDIEKSIEAGMNSHIIKPIEPQLLLQTIQSYIDSKQD